MDSLDEIESRNQRNLETAELVSAYMRANAQRAAQKAKQAAADEVKAEAANKEQEGETDSLDFSSEFSSPDMGLSDQGGFTKMLDWKNTIEEDEDEEKKRSDDEEDEESAQEWRSGDWEEAESQEDPEQEAESHDSDDEIVSESAPPEAPKPFLRPVGQSPILPPPAATSAPKPVDNASPPVGPPVSVVADASTVQPLGLSWMKETPTGTPTGEPARRPANFAPVLLPERARPEAQFALPRAGQLAQIEPPLADEAKRLIVNSANEDGYEECVRLLTRFGLGALRMCVRAKVSVQILDEQGFAEHPHLLAMGLMAEETPSDGAYLVDHRLVLVDRRSLTGQPRFFHPALYYFAHAFDHAQGGETFSSRKAAAVMACFDASDRALNGFDFVDELAAADPVRYFARSVAVYLGKDDCSDPLWSHQDLYDFDRSMYDYLQYLFARLAA